MKFDSDTLRYDPAELASDLCALYGDAGYRKFRMRKFEEYSLYLENKNFLVSEHVLAFNGLDGRLLALKPDVTLSIVKNTGASEREGEKLFYAESVYRLDKKTKEYREIEQVGLEMLGGVDAVGTLEVLSLALESLSLISERSVLAISHMGFLDAVFRSLGLGAAACSRIYACFKTEGAHELFRLSEELGLNGDVAEALAALISFDLGDADRFAAARMLAVSDEAKGAVAELELLFSELAASGYGGRVRLDFSVVSDSDYYNGIVFSGYVDGVPKAVLTGGRYDRLAAKLGKSISALGFAVYLSELSYFLGGIEEYDADYLLLYGQDDSPSTVCAAAATLRASGSVRIAREIPEGFRAREIKRMEEVRSC